MPVLASVQRPRGSVVIDGSRRELLRSRSSCYKTPDSLVSAGATIERGARARGIVCYGNNLIPTLESSQGRASTTI